MQILKNSFILLYYLLRANLAASSSPTIPNLFDLVAPDQYNSAARDNQIAPQPNGGEDYTIESMLPSKGTPTSLDPQFPQSQSDVQPIPVTIDRPSTPNDQSNPLELPDSTNVALENDDAIPLIPSLGGSSGGSGTIDIGGPNIFQNIQQNIQQLFQQPKPECEKRKIPFSSEPVEMFPMCCGKVPKRTGPGSCNRLRGLTNVVHLALFIAVTVKTVVGFECIPYQEIPANTSPNPKRLKRNAIPMTRRQDDIVANEPSSPIEIAGYLDQAEEDNSGKIAMTLGETSVDKPKKGRGGSKPDKESCSPEFERAYGGTPPKKPDPRGSELDDMEPPAYEDYDPEDEDPKDGCPKDDYSDLQVPKNWPEYRPGNWFNYH
ncbi:hypothetical protein MMC22_009368 [Lobaria immixta]|nr:hypothetical protein [Lobaria immixta]